MAKKKGPYIGVTGFMSRTEVNAALGAVSRKTAYRLMVGVLMSSKTLAGQTNKWPGRYPKKESIADIFVDDSRALNLIHYSTDNPKQLAAEVRKIVELAGPHLDGFQLNIAWPDPSQIQMIREMFPDMHLLLQIGGRAMEMMDSMEEFQEAVGWYVPEIDSILIDPSGGKGQLLNAMVAAEYLRIVRPSWKLGIGVAGGLGPRTVPVIEPLVREFPSLSIDAEGQLRTPQPEDALDIRAMEDYIVIGHLVLEGSHASRF